MKNKSGNTALGAAAARLMEQYEPDNRKLFKDPVVYQITNPVLRFILKFKFLRNYFVSASDKIFPGIFGGQICRTKFIDEKTLSILKEIQQILILGAGLDTRAYRLEGIDQKIIYEVDLPNIQQIKKKGLKKYLGRLPSNVHFIPVDFNREKTETILKNTSFDFIKSTLIILEAVTQYLNPDAVYEVFSFISKFPNGSYLLFTYILRDVIEKKAEGANKIIDWSEKKHCPFLFGINPSEIKSFLEKHNLEMLEDVGTNFYQENYLKPRNRNISVYEGERTNFSRINK